VLTIALVVMVIFLFLRNVSATVIPSLALPMSVVGTFGAMAVCGYTLDNLSLMALTLSVGFVVDDAIVILENIVRHIEMGKPRMQAAIEGAREIGFTILSMTLSLAAVFIPVLFMGGIMGRLFHEFAVTISVAILISGFVSLSLTPMLCSRFLKLPGTRQNAFQRGSEKVFDGLRDLYGWSLRGVMRHHVLTMLLGASTLLATVYLYGLVPKGFIPNQDTGQLQGSTEAPQDISFDAMVKAQQLVADIIAKDPGVEALSSSVGGGGGGGGGVNSTNAGRIFMRLKPREARQATPEEVIERLRPKLNAIPGIRTYLQNPPLVRIGGQVSRSLYQYTLQAPEIDVLYRAAADFEKRMRAIPSLTDINSDLQISSPQVIVDIDRDRASALGLTADGIENALYNAYGSRQVSSIYTSTNDYQVILELLPKYQIDPNVLNMLYISSGTRQQIALGSVARLHGRGALSVAHLGQLPAVTISFNLLPGVSPGRPWTACSRPPLKSAGYRAYQLPGRCGCLSILARRNGSAAGDGDPGDLHGAGHSLRELHPPDHDSLRPSLRRTGRAGHPADFPRRAEHLFFRRHHHADRDRQKERYYDDRFRAGSAARTRHGARRGYIRSVPGALPSHHDDYHGGADGNAADRARLRRRRRGAPPAGARRRRRPGSLAAAHPLHHARVLPLYGTRRVRGIQGGSEAEQAPTPAKAITTTR
jgi:multidrug efflux pump subunit AcrB